MNVTTLRVMFVMLMVAAGTFILVTGDAMPAVSATQVSETYIKNEVDALAENHVSNCSRWPGSTRIGRGGPTSC